MQQDGRTALMLAARNGHLQAVQAILCMGVSVDARDKNGSTALDVAATAEIERLLRAAGDHNCNGATQSVLDVSKMLCHMQW